MSTEEKYTAALELIRNINTVLADVPENKPVRKLLTRFADEVL